MVTATIQEAEEVRHTMSTLGRSGDVKLSWNPRNTQEVQLARETFDTHVKDGFAAFKMTREGKKSSLRIFDFDPDIKEIVLVPQLSGG